MGSRVPGLKSLRWFPTALLLFVWAFSMGPQQSTAQDTKQPISWFSNTQGAQGTQDTGQGTPAAANPANTANSANPTNNNNNNQATTPQTNQQTAQTQPQANVQPQTATPGTPQPTATPKTTAAPKTKAKVPPGPRQYRPIRVSAQGQQFCQNIVQTVNVCPEPYPVDTLDLQKFKGLWYLIGSNAQSSFDIFSQKGAQCVTTQFDGPGRVRGRTAYTMTNSGLVFGNPMRMLETVVISQNAASVGMGVKYLCQFMVGQEPLSTIIPQLKPIVGAASRLTVLQDLQKQFSLRWTKAVRSVTNNNKLFTGIIDSVVTPRVTDAVKSVVSKQPTMDNPLTLGALQLLGSYASISKTALDTTITVQGLSNAVSLWTVFATLTNGTRGRLGQWAATVVQGVSVISMYSEQVFAALERLQRQNMALSGGNWPNRDAVPGYVSSIGLEATRIQYVTQRMQAERHKIFRAGGRLYGRLNATAGADPTLIQGAQAIITLAKDNMPMDIAIKHINNSCQDIKKTIAAIGSGFQLPQRTKDVGIAVQSTDTPGNFTTLFGERLENYNIVQLDGAAAMGYSVALAWSCSASFETGFLPENKFYILSRQPNVPRAVIVKAKQFLRDNAIVIAGHNVMLYNTHDNGRCNPIIALP